MRILNADDVAENRYLLEFLLRSAGHEVVSVQDGEEALAAVAKGDFDLVLSDILMPRMDGFQLCRELKQRAETRGIPFVFYTATYTDEKDEALGLSLGAARFLVKPQEPAALLRVVAEVAEERRRPGGAAPAAALPEEEYLATYKQRLVRKLDAKVAELSALSRRLSDELAAREREMAERRRAEEALATAQRVAAVGSFELGPAGPEALPGAEVRCSRELLRIAGLARPEDGEAGTALRAAADLVAVAAPPDRPRLQAALRAALADGVPARLELVLHPPGGERREVQVNVEAGPPGPGGGRVLAGTVQDVTERRQLEAMARQAQKMENLGLLAAGIAHDFKNVLASVFMNAESLLAGDTLRPADRVVVEEIAQAGERARDLTRQLLLFAQRRPLSVQPLDLREVVSGLVAMLRRIIGRIHLECELPLDPLPTTGDPGLLGQVVMNLAVNARDASPEGGRIRIEAGRVEVGAHHAARVAGARPGPALRLVVADEGDGIAPEHLPRIFEPFFTTKPEGKGTGLGLATVYGIVAQHGGWVEVESAVGAGTRFLVYLPPAPPR